MTNPIGEIEFGSTRIAFVIRRSGTRNTLAVTVHPDTSVSVAAPKGTRRDRICGIVAEKAEWILRQQEHFRRHHNGYMKQYVSGESFFYLGRQHTLKVRKSSPGNANIPMKLIRGQLLVTVPRSTLAEEQPQMVRQILVRWYRRQAHARIPSIVDHFASALGLWVGSVRIRDMRKRWGSADQEGNVSFNWRIMMAPRRLVEYVVVHELCHLKHHDHSKSFWKLLERAMPDYERRRMELAVHGPKYDLTQCTNPNPRKTLNKPAHTPVTG